MSSQVKGPFGFWPFPIINMILQMLQTRQLPTVQAVAERALPAPQKTRNTEKWEWTDYKGNKREFTIHREVTSEY